MLLEGEGAIPPDVRAEGLWRTLTVLISAQKMVVLDGVL
jgi:hypothetical protein